MLISISTKKPIKLQQGYVDYLSAIDTKGQKIESPKVKNKGGIVSDKPLYININYRYLMDVYDNGLSGNTDMHTKRAKWEDYIWLKLSKNFTFSDFGYGSYPNTRTTSDTIYPEDLSIYVEGKWLSLTKDNLRTIKRYYNELLQEVEKLKEIKRSKRPSLLK